MNSGRWYPGCGRRVPNAAMAGVVLGVVIVRYSMVFCGFSAPGPLGMTCPRAIPPIRPALVDSNAGRRMAPWNVFCASSHTPGMSAGALIGANASSMACLSRRKKGGPRRSDSAGPRYEAHGRGRPRGSSYRRIHPECFAARRHPRRSHPGKPMGPAPTATAHRRPSL